LFIYLIKTEADLKSKFVLNWYSLLLIFFVTRGTVAEKH
jgi:hypothetical protein